MNFPEFPESAFFLSFLYPLIIGSPKLFGIPRHFPGERFWDLQIPSSGEHKVDVLGSGDRSRLNLVAPYRAILRYYRCDTPYCAILIREVSTPP